MTTDAPPPSHTSPLFTFDGADNISIAHNTYGSGFNQRVNTANMATSEVTVTGDDLSLNADNITAAPVTVTYASSDTAVATVDDNGRIKAVGSGTSSVTARATIGGVQVTSHPVTVCVLRPEESTGQP